MEHHADSASVDNLTDGRMVAFIACHNSEAEPKKREKQRLVTLFVHIPPP